MQPARDHCGFLEGFIGFVCFALLFLFFLMCQTNLKFILLKESEIEWITNPFLWKNGWLFPARSKMSVIDIEAPRAHVPPLCLTSGRLRDAVLVSMCSSLQSGSSLGKLLMPRKKIN